MKKLFFLNLIIAFMIGSCIQQESKFPQGAWDLIQGDAVYGGDSVVNLTPDLYNGRDVKIWSEHNYNYVGRFKHDTSFLEHYGGGTYTINGNRYEENIIWDYKKDAVGVKVKMLLELRNDTLFQIFPVDEKGEPNQDFHYVQRYVRLK